MIDYAPALDALWSRLAALSGLRFEARSGSATGWTGVGTGLVKVLRPNSSVLVAEETGTWYPERGQPLPFRNTFRWTQQPEHVRLEHLRFGPDHPVLLFDLTPAQAGLWQSSRPHVCVHDRYEATLRVEPDALLLTWTIRGPEKHERIAYRYT